MALSESAGVYVRRIESHTQVCYKSYARRSILSPCGRIKLPSPIERSLQRHAHVIIFKDQKEKPGVMPLVVSIITFAKLHKPCTALLGNFKPREAEGAATVPESILYKSFVSLDRRQLVSVSSLARGEVSMTLLVGVYLERRDPLLLLSTL